MQSLTVLEAGSLRSSCHQGWFLVRPLLLAWRWPPSPCVLICLRFCACVETEMEVDISDISSNRDISPPTLLTLFNLIISLWPLSPNIATLGVRTSAYGFGGTNSVHNTFQTCSSSYLLSLQGTQARNLADIICSSRVHIRSISFGSCSTVLMPSP